MLIQIIKAAPILRVVLCVLQAALTAYGLPVPIAALANSALQSSPTFFQDMINDLDQVAPPVGTESVLPDINDSSEIDRYLRESKPRTREALLAIKEVFGELTLLSNCGLTKRIAKKDGRVMWILDDEFVIRAFEDKEGEAIDFKGTTPDEIYEDFKKKYAAPSSSQSPPPPPPTAAASSNANNKKKPNHLLGRLFSSSK
jgi:hypothetical protein